jgi:hypothetical protein
VGESDSDSGKSGRWWWWWWVVVSVKQVKINKQKGKGMSGKQLNLHPYFSQMKWKQRQALTANPGENLFHGLDHCF